MHRPGAPWVPTSDSHRRRPAAPRGLPVWAVIVCGLSVPPGVVFAKVPLGRQWPAVQQVSFDEIDHSVFDALLRRYVDADGLVDYESWKASTEDRTALETYLASLSRGSLTRPANRSARLAFWINAYNALTLEAILQEYPTSSIRNHTARGPGYNIWKDLPLIVGDRRWSLDAIEHKVLRPMGEPRIHFAIVCASVGCPRLRNEAYVASRLNEQLDENARDFFSRTQNLQMDAASRTLRLSAILDWFGKDFGRTRSEQLGKIARYLPDEARRLAASDDVQVEFLDYDWSLNDQRRRRLTSSSTRRH